ncbi:UDP-N-acetylmuramyl-tripeptide synthetase [Spirochaetia bacterium]|nr:UDP-N-acetylmuramyl-tripeptide synthetase [Spirochaetia bacterium]
MNYLNDFFDDDTAGRAGLMEKRPGKNSNPAITGLEYDSRRVKPGNLYFALPGLHTDGHAFVDDAIKRGAVAILHQNPLPFYDEEIFYIRVKDSRFALSPVAAAFYGFPGRHLTLIGVTGTEGKSTTVYLIYQLLRLLGKKAGFVSTVRYSHGEDETDNPEHQTTPEATDVHRHLAAMRENGAEYAVLECSSHGLSPRTNRLGDVLFDAGIMTNVTREHLEFHGTWEQYREDKSRLFRALCTSGFGVVNADDPSAAYFAAATERPVYSFSTRGGKADLSVEKLDGRAAGSARGNTYEVRMQSTGKIIHIQDELPGAFNAGNVLAALITVSKILDMRIEEIVPLVPSLKPVRGRMTPIRRGQPFEVIVDYAHTPSSFAAIFPAERQRLNCRGGRIISVFGSAGERDRGKRPEQGRIARDYSDIVILTDEDPRGENPMDILEEIAQGCEATPGCEANSGCEKMRGEELFLIPNRPAAIREAFKQARPGDLVLLLGKGHENSIIYAKETLAYDESTEAEKALEEMGFVKANS